MGTLLKVIGKKPIEIWKNNSPSELIAASTKNAGAVTD